MVSVSKEHGVQLRVANTADVSALRQLEQLVVEAERPFNSKIKSENAVYYDLNALISDQKALLIVGESQGKIVASGYIQIRHSKQALEHDQHGYLGFMFVAPEYRGRGVNQMVMQHLMEWGMQSGIRDFYLDVYHGNRAAISAYEKLGFAPSLVEMKVSL